MIFRKFNKAVTTHKKREIDQWKLELDAIPEQVRSHSKTIESFLSVLKELRAALKKHEDEKVTPVQKKIIGMEAQIQVLRIPVRITRIKEDLVPLREKLGELEPQYAAVEKEIKPIQENITKYKILVDLKNVLASLGEVTKEIRERNLTTIRLDARLVTFGTQIRSVNKLKDTLELQLNMQRQLRDADNARYQSERDYSSSQTKPADGGYGSSQTRPSDGGYGSSQTKPGDTHKLMDECRDANIAEMESQLDGLLKRLIALKQEEQLIKNEVNENKQKLSAAEKRKPELENILSQFTQDKIDAAKASDMKSLRQSLQTYLNQKKSPETRRMQLSQKIEEYRQEIDRMEGERTRLTLQLTQNEALAVNYASITDEDELERLLEKQRQELQPLLEEKQRLEKAIEKNQLEKAIQQQSIEALQLKQARFKSNTYLVKLWDEPSELCNQLANAILTQVENYETKFPANQNIRIRIALHNIANKIKCIEDQTPGEIKTDDIAAKNAEARRKYFQLCGLIWNMLDRLAVQEDQEFGGRMMAAMGPDGLDHDEAKADYLQLQRQYQDLNDLNAQELQQRERKEFIDSYESLQDELRKFPKNRKEFKDLHDRGKEVSEAIYGIQDEAWQKQDVSVDTKFHTTVLKKTQQLLLDPGNQRLQKEYEDLTEKNEDGKPSLCIKLAGAMIAFLGAALIIGCVVAKAASLGLSSFLTIPGLVVGACMVVDGLGIFACGLQGGSQKKMAQFNRAAGKAGFFYRPETSVGGEEGNRDMNTMVVGASRN